MTKNCQAADTQQGTTSSQQPLAILRLEGVKGRTGLSRSTIYAMAARSEFPAAIQLGNNARAVGWLSHEIEAWLQQQISKSRQSA